MNAGEYLDQCINVTENKDFFTLAQRLLSKRSIRLLHAGIGLCTEVSELIELANKHHNTEVDNINLMEESGDLSWYHAVLCDELGYDFDVMTVYAHEKHAALGFTGQFPHGHILLPHITRLAETVGLLQDLLKKSVFYGKQIDETKLRTQVQDVLNHIVLFSKLGNFTVFECRARNTKKLADKKSGRFKTGFSETQAIHRNLEEERKILEGKV